jgi:hypothetical protein
MLLEVGYAREIEGVEGEVAVFQWFCNAQEREGNGGEVRRRGGVVPQQVNPASRVL